MALREGYMIALNTQIESESTRSAHTCRETLLVKNLSGKEEQGDE